MNFNSPIARSGIRKPRESSQLTSPRDPNSAGHVWKRVSSTIDRSDDQTQAIAQLRQEVALLKAQRPASNGMHPFKIYQFPRVMRKFKNNDDWRRFKVRWGKILPEGTPTDSTGFFGSMRAYGTDFVQPSNSDEYGIGQHNQTLPTDGSTIVPGLFGYDLGGWNEFTVPNDGVAYDVWFSFFCDDALFDASGTTSAGFLVVKDWDANEATSLATGETVTINFSTSGGYWDGPYYAGVSDPYNIKIGSVLFDDGRPVIQQEVYDTVRWRNPFANIPMHHGVMYSPGCAVTPRFCGEYSGGNEYFVGDQVMTFQATADPSGGLGSYNRLGFLSQYIYLPDSQNSSAYDPATLQAPMHGVSPIGNSPDPWILLSRSPVPMSSDSTPDLSIAYDWTTGAYDSSKFYIRKT